MIKNATRTVYTTPRMRTAVCTAVSGIVALLLSATPLLAQGAPPRPPRPVAPDSLRTPPQAPAPALLAPARGSAQLQRATPAVVLPPAPGGPPPTPPRSTAVVPSKAPPVLNAQVVPPPPPMAGAATPATPARALMPNGPPPVGTTMRCKDGTYLTGTPNPANCATHQGVAVIFPTRAVPTGPERVHRP